MQDRSSNPLLSWKDAGRIQCGLAIEASAEKLRMLVKRLTEQSQSVLVQEDLVLD
jgi:hypothetical protein